MELLTLDYVLCAAAGVLLLLGLFRGFSGTLAFAVSLPAAAAAATFGWRLSADFTTVGWQRALGVVLATVLVYGLVRWAVKRTVNGLLSQPSDAIFGALVALAAAALALVAWAYSGFYVEYSNLATLVAAFLG